MTGKPATLLLRHTVAGRWPTTEQTTPPPPSPSPPPFPHSCSHHALGWAGGGGDRQGEARGRVRQGWEGKGGIGRWCVTNMRCFTVCLYVPALSSFRKSLPELPLKTHSCGNIAHHSRNLQNHHTTLPPSPPPLPIATPVLGTAQGRQRGVTGASQ